MNSRWILSEIKAKYKHHVACVCKVRKYSTLVFRPTSDIHALLSEALWKLKPFQESRDKANSDIAPTSGGDNEIATCSIPHINSLLHTQIQSYIGRADTNAQDYDELNIDEQIAKIDPLLWSAIRCMTRSKSEIRGISKVHDPTSQIHHVKKIRCFFLLCVIMFITDERCSMPMHTLMTDMVESQGGSSVLVKTLNRLGVCSSADTLARFIQHRRSNCEKTNLKHLKSDAFTVVSADNIDFLHSFSRVFCGNHKASWHGTTVQITQPLPSLSLPEHYVLPQSRLCTGSQMCGHGGVYPFQTSGHGGVSPSQTSGHGGVSPSQTSGHGGVSPSQTSGHGGVSLPD